MHLTFDPNLDYQQRAVKSIVGLFEGQPFTDGLIPTGNANIQSLFGTFGNTLRISQEQILKNLQSIQAENGIALSDALDGMHFSVEMETGTGKTYVYVRTIYELNKIYGFKKFVIVVPSVAIREGVLKNLQITYQHFQTLYEKPLIHFMVYDGSHISALRGFAFANNIEILVINIDSFAKDENIINKPSDRLSGQTPLTFIRSVHPIVIIDEPQNMETAKRTAAIENLNPLCTLRYSATHKNIYNLVYSLNPIKAYDLGLVKQIEVDSIIEENAYNDAFVSLEKISATKASVTAKLTIHCNGNNGVSKKMLTVKIGDDLYKRSGERSVYKDGYIIEEIDAVNQSISFANGKMVYVGTEIGGLHDEILKFQIRKTIEEHLKKEKRFKDKGIKVLSLFFIDKVAHYRSYTEDDVAVKGKFAQWFEDMYREYSEKDAYKELCRTPIDEVHNGYFSSDTKGKLKDTNGQSKADNDTYNLIMKDKEKLLNPNNPLRFIFSHSALREGWDNPNVFQICTLNETKSEMKKRQEIGRGLRLAVDKTGRRIYDKNINRLTVIANESYEDFAKRLQQEIEEECGVDFSNRIKNARNRTQIQYRKGFQLDPAFLDIWEKLKYKTVYRVHYSTDELIKNAAKALRELPEIKQPLLHSVKVGITMTDSGIGTDYVSENISTYSGNKWIIPDFLTYIQERTQLTRKTVFSILNTSGRMGDILINPQHFLDLATAAIKQTLYDLMIGGITYRKIGDTEYEMRLFEDQILETYLNDFSFTVNKSSKTIYENIIPLDSHVENRFAYDCETSEQIKFYFKLPCWFKIPTPIGSYNPDWALVFEDEKKIYFVAETKDTGMSDVDFSKLHKHEQLKIVCAKAHFAEFENIEYKVVNSVGALLK